MKAVAKREALHLYHETGKERSSASRLGEAGKVGRIKERRGGGGGKDVQVPISQKEALETVGRVGGRLQRVSTTPMRERRERMSTGGQKSRIGPLKLKKENRDAHLPKKRLDRTLVGIGQSSRGKAFGKDESLQGPSYREWGRYQHRSCSVSGQQVKSISLEKSNR